MTPHETPSPTACPADRGTPELPLDLLCVGVGPFGLGLACLTDPLRDVRAAFLDAADGFDWHPGLLFEDATLQVPFLADLVTMADPTSRFSFLQWLKETDELYPFYVRESFYPLRRDYNAYCRWAAERARGIHWGHRVTEVTRPAGEGPWCVTAAARGETRTWWTRHLVVGAGTVPTVPPQLEAVAGDTVHAGDYLGHREDLLRRRHVTVVGSGQSAAEVFLDLVSAPDAPAVDWITRSPRFYPMEYSKLSLELTSPDYLDHFRALPEADRERLNASQPQLHRGISDDTIDAIHEALYVRRHADAAPVRLVAATELTDAWHEGGRTVLRWRSTENHRVRETVTDAVVAATGYRPADLDWLAPVTDQLSTDAAGRLSPDRHHRASPDGTVHVLNHGEHTHALTAPDLGMGPLRNAHVLAHVTGRAPYATEEHTTFQSFGRIPQGDTVPRLAAERWGDGAVEVRSQDRTFSLRPVDPERDLALLHGWLSAPRAHAWELVDATPEQVLAEYRRMAAAPGEDAWIVSEHGTPLALLETYDPARSPLAAVWPVRDGDAGLHLFVAPADRPVPGTTRAVMAAALRFLWSDPGVQRVLVEPDVRNERIRAINRWAGFREVGEARLPGKTACVSVVERPAAQDDAAPVHGAARARGATSDRSTDPAAPVSDRAGRQAPEHAASPCTTSTRAEADR
ncbi:siderophore biosynthesis protein [Kocuria tytonicola]|uniref:GNAT family N-acetyltransferase n=1 Tax=Kocuria tytonicola TaxID=2055946 RepID=UPI000EF8B4E3|nr:GNAT family N-acetyltransferase [Kocuria tytonicola]RLZ04350.1 siderophore biosynthesis protein [Kocuria tytonicola]